MSGRRDAVRLAAWLCANVPEPTLTHSSKLAFVFECAVWLDIEAQNGHLKHWVRNLVRRESASFSLQKATGSFYPDFVCKCNDDATLIVEYKGANAWTDAADDRLIGGLWAQLSGGTCRCVMVKAKQWQQIAPLLSA